LLPASTISTLNQRLIMKYTTLIPLCVTIALSHAMDNGNQAAGIELNNRPASVATQDTADTQRTAGSTMQLLRGGPQIVQEDEDTPAGALRTSANNGIVDDVKRQVAKVLILKYKSSTPD